MHVPTATRQPLRLRLSALALTLLVLFLVARAKAFQFGFGGPSQPELTPPQADVVSGPTAARLEQAKALAADKNWNEAVDAYRELADDDSGRVVPLDDNRYVSLRTYCQLQLAQLPAEGLAAYRRTADPLAQRWYREGAAERDEPKLRRVVDEMFCSSWGDDALLALGEIALEKADVGAARGAWEQISPLLRDPNGLPLWLALRDIDVKTHWPEIEKHWLERAQPPQWLAYPDTQLDLADVRARLILASIRAGEFERAALELDVFRHMHPTSVGRFGGQDGPYVAALERLLSTAREWSAEPRNEDWPTFAGSQSRSSAAPPLGPINGPAWAQPVKLPKKLRIPRTVISRGLNVGGGPFGGGLENDAEEQESENAVRESERPLSCFPIIVGQFVIFNDGMEIRAVELATGRPAITSNGVLHREEPPDISENWSHDGDGGTIAYESANGVPRCTLTAVKDVVYGRAGRFATTRLDSQHALPGDRLVGIDLARDGLLTFQTKPADASWSFDGAPVSDGRRVWVAMRHSDVTPHAYVSCFDAASSARLWRTSIGAADTPASGSGDEITHNLLTLVGDRIYFNTNLGLIAALDASSGEIDWLHRYDRVSSELMRGLAGPLHFDRDPSPCMYHDGLVIVAPSDTPDVFALDAQTGARVWITNQLPDALHLLGVVQQSLIVSGNRLWSLDVRSGTKQFVWPESEHAGIRGMGRGLIGGDEVFWPTRDAIYVMHAVTGERTRTPIKLSSISQGGANLAAAHGRLIIAGYDTLTALGPNPPATSKPAQPPDTALRTGRFSDQSRSDQ
ncbi:MAG: PQQ-binding-like beta-propeller repeat protein [Planctomycetes bacterium]|nr:PQQ-binding-like beta-propeller repeat protein [Planctomycetota bacterium]